MPHIGAERPRAMSTRSATTALAVGPPPAPPALQHDPAHRIALGHHRVEHAIDARQRIGLRHHARIHARLDPIRRAARDAEQLDAITEVMGERDVEGRDGPDALDMHRRKIEPAG